MVSVAQTGARTTSTDASQVGPIEFKAKQRDDNNRFREVALKASPNPETKASHSARALSSRGIRETGRTPICAQTL